MTRRQLLAAIPGFAAGLFGLKVAPAKAIPAFDWKRITPGVREMDYAQAGRLNRSQMRASRGLPPVVSGEETWRALTGLVTAVRDNVKDPHALRRIRDEFKRLDLLPKE